MSKITTCASYSGRIAPALPPGRMLQVVLAFTVPIFFLAAHLNLRFSMNLLSAETIRLQVEADKLRTDNAALVAQNEAMKQPDHLLSYARHEIGMVPIGVTEKETLEIPSETRDRYALARASRAQAPVSPEDRLLQQRAIWLSAMGERMGLSNSAQASEKPKPESSKLTASLAKS